MLTVRPADDFQAPRDGTLRDMNVKVRVVAICLALSALAGLVLLVVRPSVNPAHVRPLPLIALAWIAVRTAAAERRPVPVHLGRRGAGGGHRPVRVRPRGSTAGRAAG